MMSGHMLLKKIKEQLPRPACLVKNCTKRLHALLLMMQTRSGQSAAPCSDTEVLHQDKGTHQNVNYMFYLLCKGYTHCYGKIFF